MTRAQGFRVEGSGGYFSKPDILILHMNNRKASRDVPVCDFAKGVAGFQGCRKSLMGIAPFCSGVRVWRDFYEDSLQLHHMRQALRIWGKDVEGLGFVVACLVLSGFGHGIRRVGCTLTAALTKRHAQCAVRLVTGRLGV